MPELTPEAITPHPNNPAETQTLVDSEQPTTLETALEIIEKLKAERDQALQERDAAIELSDTDPLTELYNRRGGEKRAKELLEQASRGDIVLAYVRIDIDDFKKLNDTFGHDWGDEILKQLAALLEKTKRKSDIAFRYGGEEFDLLLTFDRDATPKDVNIAINRFLVKVATLYRAQHDPEEEPSDKTKLTASFGASIISKGASITLEEAQKMADQALYIAKENGRNQARVCYAHDYYSPPKKASYWKTSQTPPESDQPETVSQ